MGNATVLHYTKNNDVLRDGDLLLVDAGGEYEHYASDITRTWAINGRFSQPQREIYEIVLEAQIACIEMIKPGVTRAELTAKTNEFITSGLIRLGLLEGNLETESFKQFYMHSFGHYLGLDVHDCMGYHE